MLISQYIDINVDFHLISPKRLTDQIRSWSFKIFFPTTFLPRRWRFTTILTGFDNKLYGSQRSFRSFGNLVVVLVFFAWCRSIIWPFWNRVPSFPWPQNMRDREREREREFPGSSFWSDIGFEVLQELLGQTFSRFHGLDWTVQIQIEIPQFQSSVVFLFKLPICGS